jgi:hypothetical protein
MNCAMRRVSLLAAGLVATLWLGAKLAGPAVAGQEKPVGPALNELSAEEKKAGWKLLFDGKSFDGWHNYKKEGVRPGWQIKDGAMVCSDPGKGGDIVTNDKYDWFELSLEFNMAVGSNSGIMFHVTNEGGSMWQSGPEIQLLDNVKGGDGQKCGWLYQLYKPANDPTTNQPIDATKPAGQWNQIRVVIAPPPTKSEVAVNDVKYYDFVWNSDEFKDRIAKSKFKTMASFAKSDTGLIGLQGDHGVVSFRNIKLRSIALPGTDAPKAK